jgi:multicomponent Na+:H+ antiporter subunit D
MNSLLVMPVILPLLFGILLLLVWKHRFLQHTLALLGAIAQFGVAITLMLQVADGEVFAVALGNWPAPFGIVLVADRLAGILLFMATLLAVVMTIYSFASMDSERASFGFYPIFSFLMMGVNGSFLTGDIFNLYVWFEVMLMSSFILLALGGERKQMEGAIKYVIMNLFASALFLAAVGILYGKVGTLNMADIAVKFQSVEDPRMVTTIGLLFLVAFGIKAAIFPLFFWLPASYHTPPITVTAIYAGLLTKVGVYALIRVFTLIFTQETGFTHELLMVLAGFTMVTGVLGAAAHYEVRRLLAFHIISQIGYMIMGLALLTPLAIGGAVFYVAHNMVAKTNLFLISGVVNRLRGHYDLKKLGGLYAAYPGLSILFLIAAMGLAGVPPLSGFFGKLTIVVAALQEGRGVMVTVALFTGLLTLFSMTKIWAEGYWKKAPEDAAVPQEPLVGRERACLMIPVILLALGTVLMGAFAGTLVDLALQTGEQLMQPEAYINAVLGGERL